MSFWTSARLSPWGHPFFIFCLFCSNNKKPGLEKSTLSFGVLIKGEHLKLISKFTRAKGDVSEGLETKSVKRLRRKGALGYGHAEKQVRQTAVWHKNAWKYNILHSFCLSACHNELKKVDSLIMAKGDHTRPVIWTPSYGHCLLAGGGLC